MTVTNYTDTESDVFAGCPAAEPYVIGGGGSTDGAGSLIEDEPYTQETGNTTEEGWLVQSSSAASGAAAIGAYAICAK